ncbi:putative DNA glycosylase, helix-turn-helix, base-excision DNA repair [Medicago truncatula]|nr:putative DNA glycosylase, helix-turn-helix, base-excision DNA repair [Medicago truncatula]
MQKRVKRKRYRPKVVSQFPKVAKKFSKSSNTPKPVTPKQRKSYVRKSAKTCECQRPLFVDDGNSISLPFLLNFNNTKIEKSGFESSTITNVSAIEYNSLQSYQKMTSLSSLCLVENRRIGGNFPIMCKRKRVKRERINLVKLLNPFAKGSRSKTFIRKRKCWKDFYVEGNSTTISRKMKTIIKKIISSNKKIHRKANKRNVRKKSGELVLYERPLLKVNVKFDEETLRVWNLLVAENKHDEKDEHKRRYWEEIRKAYHEAVESFLTRVHNVQGDRRFLPWKGSVLDSIGGVFLTQNVSDHLSSSAFMSLAARFPVKSVSCEQSNNMIFSDPKSDKKVEEMEAQKANESSKVVNKETQNSSYLIERKSNSSSNKEETHHDTKKSKKQEEKMMILKKKRQKWEALRKIHSRSDRHIDHVDSIDWEAVRNAKVGEVAEAIKMRGQHNIIAKKIQLALNKFLEHHGTTDLEWLKYIPPNEAKEYLLNIFGLGLKSVECLRLLTLQHISFPVDVNVGRIVVRLGWVPLQPLPESIQIHNLEQFPDPIKIQQYLWPRLCKLDHHTL